MDGKLKINEIYLSVQGESTWAGLPCVFVRLTGCDSRCSYCDTEYAFYEGLRKSLHEVFAEVMAFECPLVEITGGEPLLQRNVFPLMTGICDADRTVLIETSGARHLWNRPARARIMDLKTPSVASTQESLFEYRVSEPSMMKFVIGSREDYEWSREQIGSHALAERVKAVLLSPVSAASNRARSSNGCWMTGFQRGFNSDSQIHLGTARGVYEPRRSLDLL